MGNRNQAVRAAQTAFHERVGNEQDRMAAALDAALPHLTDAQIPDAEYQKAFARGVRIGREEAHAETVTAEVGPSDYEVWRDALQLAVGWLQVQDHSPVSQLIPSSIEEFLMERAEWFWDKLKNYPTDIPSYEPAYGDRHAYEQGDDGCTHCDADALDLIHEVG